MNPELAAIVTGSGSIRLTWQPGADPGALFTVYRGTSSSFGSATEIAGPLTLNTQWYNDYTCAASTQYWYWIEDQNSNLFGPATATTIAASENQDAIDEPQLDALQAWAEGVWGFLYPAYWRYQDGPQQLKPTMRLNVVAIQNPGFSDYEINLGEALAGGRVATLSVQVNSSAAPPVRGLLNVTALEATTYSLTANGTTVSVTYASAPSSATQVITALQAQLDALQPQAFNTMQYGPTSTTQGLIVENYDATGGLSATVAGPLSWATYTPPKAMTIAQRLQASLGDPDVLDTLWASGIGVGQRQAVQDVSAMLDTESELIAQFDVYLDVAEIYPITPGVIDTVTAPTGTYVN